MEGTSTLPEGSNRFSLSRVVRFCVLVVVFLLPLFFIPGAEVPVGMSKSLLFIIGSAFCLALYIVYLIREARIAFPKNLLTLSLILLPIVFIISALSNGAKSLSFVGYNLDVGSVVFISAGTILALVTSFIFKSKEKIFYSYLIFLAAFLLLAMYEIIKIFFSTDALSFGLFAGKTSSLVGSWNDMAIFFALTAILSLITLEMIELGRFAKPIFTGTFILSLVLLAIANFSTAWYMLAVFSLLFFLYVISFDHFAKSRRNLGEVTSAESNSVSAGSRKISWGSLILLILSLAFIFKGVVIGESLTNKLGTNYVEVRPNWTSTLMVVKDTLKDSPIVGSGPNTFTYEWLMHRPDGINETLFWNTNFSSGIGTLPSFVATTGVLGLISILFFLVMFLWTGVRSIFQPVSDSFSRYLILSSFLSALFLWLMSIFYVPGPALFGLAFFFTGLFLASLYIEKMQSLSEYSLARSPKLSFLAILLMVVLLVGGLSVAYASIEKTIASSMFQGGITQVRDGGDVDSAQDLVVKAINLDPKDTYYRGLSELYILKVNTLLGNADISTEEARQQFQELVAGSIESAKRSTEINPQEYQNWLTLAQVYGSLVPAPFYIPGAYDNAKAAYEKARSVNPEGPSIPLLLARLEASKGDLKAARAYVDEAIALKPNYAEAHFFLAQIEVTEGNLARAIPSLETVAVLSPGNPGIYFQLGLLRYNASDWTGAVDAFTAAISIVPEYANAKYFLGLSLDRLGRRQEAVAQFDGLSKSNPDNAEIALILSNLKANKSPFTGATPPIDSKPEKRSELPVDEN